MTCGRGRGEGFRASRITPGYAPCLHSFLFLLAEMFLPQGYIFSANQQHVPVSSDTLASVSIEITNIETK